jgi:hypothetical protein
MKKEKITALGIGGFLLVVFTYLLIIDKIGATSYVALFCILVIAVLLIVVHSRLQKLDLKNLSLTLAKIEEAKTEVLAKEKDLKRISLFIINMLMLSSSAQNRFVDDEDHDLTMEWYRVKACDLLDILKVTGKDRQEAMKYATLYKQIDEPGNSERKGKIHGEILSNLRKDIDAVSKKCEE